MQSRRGCWIRGALWDKFVILGPRRAADQRSVWHIRTAASISTRSSYLSSISCVFPSALESRSFFNRKSARMLKDGPKRQQLLRTHTRSSAVMFGTKRTTYTRLGGSCCSASTNMFIPSAPAAWTSCDGLTQCPGQRFYCPSPESFTPGEIRRVCMRAARFIAHY